MCSLHAPNIYKNMYKEWVNCRKKVSNMDRTLKESRVNWNKYDIGNILAPIPRNESGNVRNQYLSVSRYVAGNPAIPRKSVVAQGNRLNSGLFFAEPGI